VSYLSNTALIIEDLEGILKYEEILENKQNSKSKISAKRLSQREEEWDKISRDYVELQGRIQKNVGDLRKLLMKKIEIFEDYHKKYGLEA
jgi:hypothetical protein